MTFKEALKAMKRGAKVRLPGWLSYYWYWDEEKETVMTHSKPLLIGDEEYETDIKDERVERVFDDMLREDWMIANEENCPILCEKAVFSFGDAITYLKKGRKVARKGWNGKGMFLFVADEIHFFTKTELKKKNDEPYDMLPSIAIKTANNKCIVGWVPSQTDMLAEDWVFAE